MESEPNFAWLYHISQAMSRAIHNCYGPEVLDRYIELTTDALGQDWKNQLIINKLSGNNMLDDTPNNIVGLILSGRNSDKKIPAIKTLRSVKPMGLLEAKKLIEKAMESAITVKISQQEIVENYMMNQGLSAAYVLSDLDIFKSILDNAILSFRENLFEVEIICG